MEPLNIILWMEDFDNAELSDYERTEQLRESVQEYNEKYCTNYNPDSMVRRYVRLKRVEQFGEE